MRAGDLDRRVVLEGPITSQSASGEVSVSSWLPVCEVWASRREPRGDERRDAGQEQATVEAEYQIRYRDDITPLLRLRDRTDARLYDILGAVELGRREGLRVRVKARAE